MRFDHAKPKVWLRIDSCCRKYPGEWTRELVVNAVKHPEELDLFRDAGITIIRFADIVRQMQDTTPLIEAAAGNDLLTLMLLGKEQAEQGGKKVRGTRR